MTQILPDPADRNRPKVLYPQPFTGMALARHPQPYSNNHGAPASRFPSRTTTSTVTSPAGNVTPVTPGSTISRKPPVSATANGVRAAAASSATMPNGSYNDGTTATSAADIRAARSGSGRKPAKVTADDNRSPWARSRNA